MSLHFTRSRLIFTAGLCILILLLATTCRRAGTWLVKEDTPVHADAMVILMGSIADRVLQASDLYHAGVAGKVIIVEESMGAYAALEARGAHIISNTIQARNAAIALGIPADSIVTIVGDARSTQQEATIVRNYLQDKPGIKTLLLVSSAEHTRRASLIFRTAFEKSGKSVTIFSSPSKYTGFRAKDWWIHKEEIQAVLGEYVKLLNFWLLDRQRL